MNFKDMNISVIGMARTGIATANFLSEQGARVTLLDAKTREALASAMQQVDPRVQTVFESSAPRPDADLVVLSPGVNIQSPDLESARHKNVEIISELELAYRVSRTPIIAVTGTNGKSTTTSLIAALLEEGGKDVRVGGNIGVPFVSLLTQLPGDYLVLEVSSFQLEATVQFRPRISILLNLTPDHLDRHITMDHYAALKEKVAVNQTEEDLLIANQDDPRVRQITENKKPRKWFFSLKEPVDQGCYLKEDRVIFRQDSREETLCRVNDLKPALRLQLENILASVLTARLAGIDAESIVSGLRGFTGLPHRMEWVRTINDVDFINDSKGTNVGALEKSLNSFDRPIILIIGGQDKGGDFAGLKPLFKAKVRHMILIGEAKTKIQAVLNGSFGYEDAADMASAVQRAYAQARPGDVILLSPACASFDMFRDYMDRGDQFKACVQSL
ncbi:MAG: UDP-N-acetylmuramoyl-L-alanine--D-glutamate ligase [Nitrospinaceae bacterium]|nr:UDP-N-acetylmuramoyl-L-alanine--D-glutamate ligase [Nitrospinaceae bacterium]